MTIRPSTDQYTVKPKDNLTKIAKSFGVKLEHLMLLNKITPERAHLIYPGQKLKIPTNSPSVSVSVSGVDTAKTVGSAPFKTKPLGELSKQYETSGRGPATVSGGIDDPGGISYGSYQMASKRGTPQDFLKTEGNPWASKFGSAEAGTKAFSDTWKTIGEQEPTKFHQAQHAYIERTHYRKLVDDLNDATAIDLHYETHSHTLRDVAWSTAVHHGGSGGARIFQRANDMVPINRNKPGYDKALIDAVYAERGRVDPETGRLVYFSKVKLAKTQQSLKNRFINECGDAQAALAAELAAGGPFPEPGDVQAVTTSAAPAAGAANASSSTYPQPKPGISGPVNTQLPSAGAGFVIYNPDNPQGEDRYGTTLFVKQLIQLAEAWALQSPVPVAYGDMSHPGGTSFDPPHKGHRKGNEVDTRPFRKDGKNLPMAYTDPGYDRGRMRSFFQLVRKRHANAVILFNDPQLIKEGLCKHSPGHHNHAHIRIA